MEAVVKLFIVDARPPGSADEDVTQRILASWPAPAQGAYKDADLVRLALGSQGLCSQFSAVARSFSVAFDTFHILYEEPEPGIAWILRVPTRHAGLPLCKGRASQVLSDMSLLFALLQRSVVEIVASAGAVLAKSCLCSFLKQFMPRFCKNEGWCTLADLYTALTPHRGLPMTKLSPSLFQGVQALAATLTAMQLVPERKCLGCLLMHKQAMLHSTLPPAATTALQLFATLSIVPVVRTENRTTKSLAKLYNVMVDWGRSPAVLLDASAWRLQTTPELEGLITCVAGCGEAGAGTLERAGSWAPELDVGSCPPVFVENKPPGRLLVLELAGFTVLAVIESDAPVRLDELKAARNQIMAAIRDVDAVVAVWQGKRKPKPNALAHAVGELVKSQEKGHIHGHRYAIVDHAARTPLCMSTPTVKIEAHTSQTAKGVLAQLWDDCQEQQAFEQRRLAEAAKEEALLDEEGESDGAGAGGAEGGSSSRARADSAGEAGLPMPLRDIPLEGSGRLRSEAIVQTPNSKWVHLLWAAGSEVAHIDENSSYERASLSSAYRNMHQMLSGHFPGAAGL